MAFLGERVLLSLLSAQLGVRGACRASRDTAAPTSADGRLFAGLGAMYALCTRRLLYRRAWADLLLHVWKRSHMDFHSF